MKGLLDFTYFTNISLNKPQHKNVTAIFETEVIAFVEG